MENTNVGVTMMWKSVAVFGLMLVTAASGLQGQDDRFGFEVMQDHPTTPVKAQARTGTCWSFATTSFLESELLRMGKQPMDLSEMFFVRMNYPEKIANYVRLHGSAAMGQGSLGGDVLRILREYGAVPESTYPGRRYGAADHDHSEVYALLKATSDVLTERRPLSPVWPDAVDGVLDAYLGEPPETFTHRGTTHTPASYAAELGIDPDAYVELTSFSHHPFYTWFAIEIPDNWARNESYNLPLDEFMSVVDHALENGFTVDWDGDVSERSFCQDKGVAVLPELEWADRSDEERGSLCAEPEAEVAVTQAVRQAWFDDHSSTDDHLMHITGMARDRDGTKYYITKNSWGPVGPFDGFIYMSEAYVRAKTISVIVHRDALPSSIARRIGG